MFGIKLKVVESEEVLTGGPGDIVCEKLHNSKHCKSAILDLLGALVNQLVALGGTSGVEAEVSNQIRSLLILSISPSNKLPVSDRANDLEPAKSRDSSNSTNTVGDRIEGSAIKIDGTREASHGLDQVAGHSKHGNAAVLQLYSSSAVESLHIAISGKAYKNKQELQADIQTKGKSCQNNKTELLDSLISTKAPSHHIRMPLNRNNKQDCMKRTQRVPVAHGRKHPR